MIDRADVTLTFVVLERDPRVRVLSDGTHLYWRERDSTRIRWAMIDKPDDGIGYRSHGAAANLLLAIEDAEQARRDREHVGR